MKRKVRGIAALTLLCALATHLSGCITTAGIEPSEATCGEFLRQMQARRGSAAYTLLSSPCKAVTKLPQMQSFWDLLEKKRGKVRSWSKQSAEYYSGNGGSSVQVAYKLQCAKGTAVMSFNCVPENDKWLIQGFHLNP